ncbi:hypothetical protein A7U60_g6154 [Sanghuangporus baumii]|uniref:RNA-dependent RNA polymerase n=1 Tax=Sanghuangporus baumii TaxID=108892 RepID=A0A9Q5HVC5_SANBA|nr:hypothetical protein A7U60_g6154 [Sanghuangporus baumii]
MEIELINISFRADLYDVKEEFARILHSDNFRLITRNNEQEFRPLNFHIVLGRLGSGRHDGTGTLTLPSKKLGQVLLQLAIDNRDFPCVNSRRIRMRGSERKPNKGNLVETLRKLPYQDPSIDRERDNIRFELNVSWRIDKLQLGVWISRPIPHRGTGCQGVFAVEWEKDYTAAGNAQVEFKYDRKSLRLRLGDPFSDDETHYVVIRYSNIQHLWVGYEFKPYICLDLLTPPIFESQWTNQTQTGIAFIDTRKIRRRVGALDEHHRSIGPYAYQVRVSLYAINDLEDFIRACDVAGLRTPEKAAIISERHNFFSRKMLLEVRKSFKAFRELPWTVVFQIESFLYNGLLSTVQLLDGLLPELVKVAESYKDIIGTLLRDFSRMLATGVYNYTTPTDVARHFKQFCNDRLRFRGFLESATVTSSNDELEGLMACHHVTFTPTRMLLEGPYVIQSNRVLRRYSCFHDHFLRVDFRDEDHLQFRWEHQLDGTTLLEQRVGETLKNGFGLGGRHFEFLAYSTSALREHSVWFVSPFLHPEHGLVNAASIRREIGDLTAELAYPAKFGARMALAFSGTNPSVKISRDQWTEIPDLGSDPYLHTDGIGTISRQLGGLIWSEECRLKPGLRQYAEPSAYQIRFLGFKGVVVIDDNLEGIKMNLRPSMRKFTSHDVETADIEIANAFCSPSSLYLNRPLVMILEDREVKKEVFLELLDSAMADVHLTRESVTHFVNVMKSHGLGSTFSLNSLLQKLSVYGLDLNPRNPARNLRNPFIDNLIGSTISSVLRDIQYRCRIPVPKSYTLNVYAIGKPPPDKICAFRNLVNVIVFPSKGKRSLASCLSGGDLDGDIFNICQYQPLFGSIHDFPAEFPAPPKWEIELGDLEEFDQETGRTKVDPEKIVPFVCDFVVKYINSDVMGVLADEHLIRADQSADGVRDPGCLLLAKLCSQAVDYPKNGMEVDISRLPPKLIPFKPDWKKNEAGDEHRTDFYRSERAVGEIFRRVEKVASCADLDDRGESSYLQVSEHPVYKALKSTVDAKLRDSCVRQTTEEEVRIIFRHYYNELQYICATHTLTDHVDSKLKEEEVVIGTILARCSRHRWRTERIYRMRVHASNLVKEIREQFIPEKLQTMTKVQATQALEVAWTSWKLITDKLTTADARRNPFGLNSFSIIALNAVLECLEYLNN